MPSERRRLRDWSRSKKVRGRWDRILGLIESDSVTVEVEAEQHNRGSSMFDLWIEEKNELALKIVNDSMGSLRKMSSAIRAGTVVVERLSDEDVSEFEAIIAEWCPIRLGVDTAEGDGFSNIAEVEECIAEMEAFVDSRTGEPA